MNLTARQTAERLNVPHPHLPVLLSEGEIPSRKIGRHHFVREEDLLVWSDDVQAYAPEEKAS